MYEITIMLALFFIITLYIVCPMSNCVHFFFYIQAVEYYAEWSLCPSNVVFLRVQTAVYDPSLIGDKPKWYAHQLQPVEFKVYDNNSSLGAALTSALETHSDENPTGKFL